MMTSTMAAKIAQETDRAVIEDARLWLLKRFPGTEDTVANLSDAEVVYWTDGYYGGWDEFVTARRIRSN